MPYFLEIFKLSSETRNPYNFSDFIINLLLTGFSFSTCALILYSNFNARRDFIDQEYDEIYDRLDDPVEYFVNYEGTYTLDDLVKQSFISVDYEEVAKGLFRVGTVEEFVGQDYFESGTYYWIRMD